MTERPGRRGYLDWMRGLAVVIMVGWHTLDAWTTPVDKASVRSSSVILHALSANSYVTGIQGETIRSLIAPAAPEPSVAENEPVTTPEATSTPETEKTMTDGLDEVFHLAEPGDTLESDAVLDEGVLAYMSEHANEIAAEADHAFQPIGGIYEEFMPGAEETPTEPAATTTGPAGMRRPSSRLRTRNLDKLPLNSGAVRLQKISKLDIKDRIQLAMKGTKEERSLLIRDGTKIVALAVLESPKVQRRRSGEICRPEECARSRASRHSDEAAVCKKLFDRAGPGVQSADAARSGARADEKHTCQRSAKPVEQQGSFGHGAQTGHEDVQAKDGKLTAAN